MAHAEPRQPNILLIHWHDVGRYLGCYGVETVRTPHVDRLAESGIRFDRAFATSPLCSPARGSLFTGRYPHSNGLMGLAHAGWEYHADERTLPAILAEAGYDSVLIGLQHESSDPELLGFGEVQHLVADEQYAAPVAELATLALRSRRATDRPFFMTVGLFEPHRPWPAELYDPVDPTTVQVPDFLQDTPQTRADLAAMSGAVAVADDATGRILQTLQDVGLDDSTIVIVTTDHGMAFPGAKSTLHDAGLEVALVIALPPGRPFRRGSTDRLVSHVDVVPTLLELVGLDADPRVQGRSFAPWLLGQDQQPRTATYAEKNWHDPDQYDPVRSIRTATHRYIRSYAERPVLYLPGDIAGSVAATAVDPDLITRARPPVELYDVVADPAERDNLAGTPAAAHLERDLDARLQRWQHETGDPLLDGPIPPPRTPGRLQRALRPAPPRTRTAVSA